MGKLNERKQTKVDGKEYKNNEIAVYHSALCLAHTINGDPIQKNLTQPPKLFQIMEPPIRKKNLKISHVNHKNLTKKKKNILHKE
jgi:predicted Ser/Thr protein kinase